ncbi:MULTISPECIES: hypothetical protein [Ramlibacter]|uniref:Uncharacterized protein n=1 Tax=Ramlibacter aquaticus TaxID=2780094 RepID=A0ABR9SI51_9BURK|nr:MULTISPECIES: hypothetical protein [Ramlibacter]MBE7942028.1 hypothetical protein [Ramlibacter aquaticus]
MAAAGTPAVGVITTTNASSALAYAYSGTRDLGSQSSSATSLATGVSVQSQGAGLVAASLQQLYKGLSAQPVTNLPTGVTSSVIVACAGGGTVSATVSEAVSGMVSNGDSISLVANNCAENAEVLNGGVSFGFSNLSGTLGATTAWSGTLSINFSNFSVQSGGQTLAANGDMALGYNQAGYQVATATVSGSSLQINLTKSDGAAVARRMTAYNLSESVNSTAYALSANYTLTGTSSNLGAVLSNVNFTVKTNAPFQGSGSTDPSTGSFTVIAPDRSSATLTAIDSTNIRIDIDSNGDGVTDQTINSTWADLKSRI